jgi:protein-arginine kinase activator protein McsA
MVRFGCDVVCTAFFNSSGAPIIKMEKGGKEKEKEKVWIKSNRDLDFNYTIISRL